MHAITTHTYKVVSLGGHVVTSGLRGLGASFCVPYRSLPCNALVACNVLNALDRRTASGPWTRVMVAYVMLCYVMPVVP